ncbi:uncharacterized protein Tpl94D [Drosophila pseudoobscura]|uniref:Uncharacterized protein Tpl94D n=1 Tax=Drosophila pseudoobscura pseudoobscura TaxID=46245 RepID=A0A6I8VHJ4_DROPS|nr:uncharacterized protein LOC6902186 [Drosophila pseudoobscura]
MGNYLSKPKGETGAKKNIGFRQFLRVYKRKHSQMSPGQCNVEAARAWGKLSPAQKMRFVRSASPYTGSKARARHCLNKETKNAVNILKSASSPPDLD